MKLETEFSEKAVGSDPNAEGYINKVEVARRMNIKVRTVDNWMRRKFIPYYKLGHTVLFRWNEIEQHIGETCRVLADGHKAHSQQAVPAPTVLTQNSKSIEGNGAHGVTRPTSNNKEKTK